MKILSYQITVDGVNTLSTMKDQQARVESLIRQACLNESVDLVLLPELSAIEYSIGAFSNLGELANDISGWLVDSMGKLAKDIETSICFGMPRCARNSHYISQVIVDKNGSLVGYYDKVHVAQFGASAEKPYFNPGDHVTIFELGTFRIGIVICYDMRFSEYISKMVQEHKLDAMLHPVAFSRDGSFASWRSFVRTRALENQIYWLSLNRAGSGWGHSVFCPPWYESNNEVIVLNESESFHIIELDKNRLQQARKTYPLSLDRLADYSEIVSR
jgi:predicted amidohydrolase